GEIVTQGVEEPGALEDDGHTHHAQPDHEPHDPAGAKADHDLLEPFDELHLAFVSLLRGSAAPTAFAAPGRRRPPRWRVASIDVENCFQRLTTAPGGGQRDLRGTSGITRRFRRRSDLLRGGGDP